MPDKDKARQLFKEGLAAVNLEAFANDNNIWRSQHLKLEETGVADTFDR